MEMGQYLILISVLIVALLGRATLAQDEEIELEREGFGPGLQFWEHVEVREGAFIFYWLYYTTANVTEFTDRPLAIWLQGGPGASSTGYGNFEELGPLDLFLEYRDFNWVKDMNVLFIDNPVGTGFSYVTDYQYLTTNNTQIALDLVETMRAFYERLPHFKKVPLHIFSESYGGKMAVEFAVLLNEALDEGSIDCNFHSVSSIDGWISPIDSMWSWAPFLLNMGFVDHDGYEAIMNSTQNTQNAIDAGNFSLATDLWGYTEYVIIYQTFGIDFYNVLVPQTINRATRLLELFKTQPSLAFDDLRIHERDERDDLLTELMRGNVSEALDIPDHVIWNSQSNRVFNTLREDFMKPVTDIVEHLLNTYNTTVSIITGQLDLIVATPGTINWVDRLEFDYTEDYVNSMRLPLVVDGILEGYHKRADDFTLYWVNRAGHMVPADNPAAMAYILEYVTNNYTSWQLD